MISYVFDGLNVLLSLFGRTVGEAWKEGNDTCLSVGTLLVENDLFRELFEVDASRSLLLGLMGAHLLLGVGEDILVLSITAILLDLIVIVDVHAKVLDGWESLHLETLGQLCLHCGINLCEVDLSLQFGGQLSPIGGQFFAEL